MAERLPLATGKRKKAARGSKAAVTAAVLAPQPDDPLGSVEYTGDIEADAIAELDALESAFRDRRRIEDARFKQATDSEFWVALCFESREAKEAFLRKHGLKDLGDKYLNGAVVDSRLSK